MGYIRQFILLENTFSTIKIFPLKIQNKIYYGKNQNNLETYKKIAILKLLSHQSREFHKFFRAINFCSYKTRVIHLCEITCSYAK